MEGVDMVHKFHRIQFRARVSSLDMATVKENEVPYRKSRCRETILIGEMSVTFLLLLWSTAGSYTHAPHPHFIPIPVLPRHLPPSSVINLGPSLGLPCPDHVTSWGRDSAHAQHRDNDCYESPKQVKVALGITTLRVHSDVRPPLTRWHPPALLAAYALPSMLGYASRLGNTHPSLNQS
jgi:hypothetical protein